MSILLAPILGAVSVPSIALAESAALFRLDEIIIENEPIFTDQQAQERRLYRIVNRLHVTTRENTVRRILWVREGDLVSKKDLQEIERNLRDIGVFNSVDLQSTVSSGDDGAVGNVSVKIKTRDRVSLFPAIVPFSVGGVNGFAAVIAEENLFGNADQFFISTQNNSDDERDSRISLRNCTYSGQHHTSILVPRQPRRVILSAWVEAAVSSSPGTLELANSAR